MYTHYGRVGAIPAYRLSDTCSEEVIEVYSYLKSLGLFEGALLPALDM